MKRVRSALLSSLLIVTIICPLARGQDAKGPGEVWEDFIHYIRIARLDLAAASGRALLDQQPAPDEFLQIIEDSPYADDYDQTLIRAQRLEDEVAAVAKRVSEAIEEARLDVARNPDRIRGNIESLAEGLRARMLAEQRLMRAGEYAAPAMLEVLISHRSEDEPLRPLVIETLVKMGRPIVQPMAEAMSEMPPVAKQDIARVLARIGYPLALPYLKTLAEQPDINEGTRDVVNQAFAMIADQAGVPEDVTAAELWLLLGEDYYAKRSSLILQPDADYNLMWRFEGTGPLTALRIPTAIFPDAMAMRAGRRAMQLNPDMSGALSLWIAANFRRENNLPDGEDDPSYGSDMRSPQFYATIAGPRHLNPVLGRGLTGDDAALALDAIRALDATAGDESLLSSQTENQPLLAAMNETDRRVRFEAAMAAARAMPEEEFTGSERVVPVLAEAVRQTDARVALVLAPEVPQMNDLASQVRALGFDVLMADTIAAAAEQLTLAPGIDLVVMRGPESAIESNWQAVRQHFKLQATPVLVLARPEVLVPLNRRFIDEELVGVTDLNATDQEFQAAVEQRMALARAGRIDEAAALDYADRGLGLLRDIAISGQTIFDVSGAEPALVIALDEDPRSEVVLGAAEVLALIDSADAQVAIAESALDDNRDPIQRVRLLRSLATSAKHFGPRLPNRLTSKLLKLVDSATGELANAAAEAHGALNLPTANAVELITEK